MNISKRSGILIPSEKKAMEMLGKIKLFREEKGAFSECKCCYTQCTRCSKCKVAETGGTYDQIIKW